MGESIRWKQRFNSFMKAFTKLDEAVALSKTRDLSELESQGLIQAFEFTHELFWLTTKDYFFHQGVNNFRGSRDAVRIAFKHNLIQKPNIFMEMIESRNLSSHTYNETTAKDICNKIKNEYHNCFWEFQYTMKNVND